MQEHLEPILPNITRITKTNAVTETARMRNRINLLRQDSLLTCTISVEMVEAVETSEHSVICLLRCDIGWADS